MKTLYILRLTQNKFYIGTTANFDRRLQEHQTCRGSLWSKKYPMKSIILTREVPDEEASSQETKTTFQYMLKYGLNNVRGAEFCLLRDYEISDVSFTIAHHLNMNHNEVKSILADKFIDYRSIDYDEDFDNEWRESPIIEMRPLIIKKYRKPINELLKHVEEPVIFTISI